MLKENHCSFCLQHAWKIYAEKDKNRIPPPRSKEILLNSLNHYLYKPPVKKTVLPYSMPQPKPKPSRRFVPNKSLNPFGKLRLRVYKL